MSSFCHKTLGYVRVEKIIAYFAALQVGFWLYDNAPLLLNAYV